MSGITRTESARLRLILLAAPALVAAVSLPYILRLRETPHLPASTIAPAVVTPRPVARKIMRLNQSWGNVQRGLAINASLALKKGKSDKIAFLTFDDGPSPISKRVLAILAKNGIRATFFIVGSMAEKYPSMLKAEYQAGHAIANHSFTHVYPQVYKTPWTMIAEITRTESILEKVLGPAFRTKLFRFPGGYLGERSVFHHEKQRYAAVLQDCGMHFIDWNVDCGDTAPHTLTPKQLVANVMNESKGQNRVVVLMHDAGAKFRTAEALPLIIAGLKKRGYVFRTLD